MSKRPRLRLHLPRWARPLIVGADGRLPIVLAALAGRPTATLHGQGLTVPVTLDDPQTVPGGALAWDGHLAAGAPPGLYDLLLTVNGAEWREPNAVCIPPTDVDRLTLAHCSDLHLLKPGRGTMQDRTAHVREMIGRLNAQRPDLVVCTGDLISRYDERKRPLSAAVIRWQIDWLRQYLPGLAVPLFVTVGNHDVAFAAARPHWYAAMGGETGPAPDDWSVDWGPSHLAMPDCFAYYDDHNEVLETSFRPEQLSWLQRDLGAVPEDGVRLLFAHYDYRRQLPELLPSLRLDGFYYGHSDPLYPEALRRHSIWDGHLPARLAYQLVRLHGRSVIAQDLISWDSLA